MKKEKMEYIEMLIADYHLNVVELGRMRDPEYFDEYINETLTTVALVKRLLWTQQCVDAVYSFYSSASAQIKRVIELRYWEGQTWPVVANEIRVDVKQAQQLRKPIVERVGERLGIQ